MKKIFSFAMAAVLLMAGCVKEEISLNNDGEKVQVTFTANLPIEASRALVGDGSKVNELNYAIYDDAGELFASYLYQDDVEVIDNHATVTLDLVKGQSYKIAFWAQHSDAPYTFDRYNGVVTVDYSGTVLSNDEKLDAFYVLEPITVTGPDVKTVTLRRPFAQINLGATKADVDAAKALGIVIDKTKVTLSGVNTTLELFSGKAKDKTTAVVNFDYNALPGNDLTVNSVDYAYLAANYILANGEADVTELEFVVRQGSDDINTVKVPAVNYKRNYRTNILGRLLTSSVDFNIVIDGTPDGDISYNTWDGETITEVVPENGVYNITSPAQFAWLGDFAAGVGLKNATININLPLDMAGFEFSNLMLSGECEINGNGNTIANVNFVEAGAQTRSGHNGDAAGAGFVYVPSKAKVSVNNLTFTNCTSQGIFHTSYNGSGGAGILTTYVQGELTLNNVHVLDSKVYGVYSLGVLAGEVPGGGKLFVNNCSVEGCEVDTRADFLDGESGAAAGVIGRVVGEATINGISVKDVEVFAQVGDAGAKRACGGIVGNVRGGKFYLNDVKAFESVVVTPVNTKAEESIAANKFDEYVGAVLNNGVYSFNGFELLAAGVSQDADGNYHIINANGMKWLANEVNKYSNYEYPFKGVTVYLENDIDLNKEEWIPIGDYRFSANRFCGTFDGQNHTISNFVITKKTDKSDSNKSSYGLFGNLEGTLKNLTVANASVKSYAYTGALVGRMNNGLVENCHVVDCTVSNSYWQGGILIGQVNASSISSVVRNCTIKNSSITSASAVGAISGPVSVTVSNGSEIGGEVVFENCSVTDCQVLQSGSFGGNYDNYFASMFGYLETDSASCIKIVNCVAENTTVKGESEAPIAGKFDGVIYIDGALRIGSSAQLNEALNSEAEELVFSLATDVELNGECYREYAGDATKKIVINGNGHKLTYKDNYRTYIKLANPEGKLVLNNVKLYREAQTGTHFYDNNMSIYCDTEFNNVELNKGILLTNASKHVWNDVTITKSAVATYGMFIFAGCDVTLDGCEINHAEGVNGRGIKIVDEDMTGAIPSTSLSVANTKFTTTEKAAVLVGSKGGAVINWGENNDISGVAEDSTFAVWVDEDWAAYANLVTVNGALCKVEGRTADVVEDSEDLVAALEAGKDVVLVEDVKINPAGMSNAYGTTGINVKNGQTIDGGGHILDIAGAGGTWDSGISTTGGIIKNIKITGSFRGIFINHNSDTYQGKVVLENVIIDGTTYTISCDQGTNNGLEATNCTFKGWTSYAATLGEAKFNNCYFGLGNGYKFCRPYAPTVFNGCTFEVGYNGVDCRAKCEFINCKMSDGTAITAENINSLLGTNANAIVK